MPKIAYEILNGAAVNIRFVSDDYAPKTGELINADCDELPAPEALHASPLSKIKRAKLAEIKAASELVADQLIASFPTFERETWGDQKAEALAWKANPAAPTPRIDAMARYRGVPREIYLERTYVKVMQFAAASDYLVGTRQGYDDKVAAAATKAALSAIVPTFVLPTP